MMTLTIIANSEPTSTPKSSETDNINPSRFAENKYDEKSKLIDDLFKKRNTQPYDSTESVESTFDESDTQKKINMENNFTSTGSELLYKPLSSTGHAKPQQPICLDSKLTVHEGCQALAHYKISSAPVYDAAAGGFIGMLDFKDLVTYILKVFYKIPREISSYDAELEISDIVKKAMKDDKAVPIKFISNLSKNNPLIAVSYTSPVVHAIEEFKKSHIHRLVVVERTQDVSNKFIGVLSQSTVSAFIASKFAGEKTVQELGLVAGGVISITQDNTVLDALHTMHTHSISSVAIIDRTKGYERLLGNISMSDIKEILGDKGGYKHLFTNSFEFFTNLRSLQGLEAEGCDRAPNFTVHPKATLINAMEKMAATRSHRVW
ncbi:cell separation during budding [Clydaea vesicula]|uniref:Cell separation during budding n=1 Tax=Clydaea vesicula TaxID=447962 RepID=A0AAD5TY10_9FUNG|nr:cell separation during budding [Clydaea vesicula]